MCKHKEANLNHMWMQCFVWSNSHMRVFFLFCLYKWNAVFIPWMSFISYYQRISYVACLPFFLSFSFFPSSLLSFLISFVLHVSLSFCLSFILFFLSFFLVFFLPFFLSFFFRLVSFYIPPFLLFVWVRFWT